MIWRQVYATHATAQDIWQYIDTTNWNSLETYMRFYYTRDSKYWIIENIDGNNYFTDLCLGQNLDVGGTKYKITGLLYNGRPWWTDGNGNYIWYSNNLNGYVRNQSIGTGLIEYWDTESTSYKGNTWRFLSSTNPNGTYHGRGALGGTTEGAYNNAPSVVAYKALAGWRSNTAYGKYEKVGSTHNPNSKLYFGWKRLHYSDWSGSRYLHETDQMSINQPIYMPYDSNGNKYVSIALYMWRGAGSDNQEKWILSSALKSKGSAYYESDDDIADEDNPTMTFNRMWTQTGTDPHPANLTISFTDFVAGDLTSSDITGEANIFYGTQF